MEEFHASSVVLPLGKYHSTSTIASSRLRLAAVRGAVYPQSCRRDASLRAGGWQRQENLPERSERTIFGLDPAKSAAKPVRDREDGRIDSITIVPSDSLQQHLVAAKFASGRGFMPPETEAPKATSERLYLPAETERWL